MLGAVSCRSAAQCTDPGCAGDTSRMGQSCRYCPPRHCPATRGCSVCKTTLHTLPSSVSQLGDPRHELNLDESWRFEDARTAATSLSSAEAGILAEKQDQLTGTDAISLWSVCGQRTEPGRGGQVRKCMACKADHFPRTDPVVIMVVTDGERCLSGRVEAGCRGRGHTRRWPGSWTRGSASKKRSGAK